MPAQSRAQRRRANTRQQTTSAPKPRIYTSQDETPVLVEQAPVEVASVAAPTSNSRVARRLRTRTASEPVDYTKDYRDATKDLRLIAIWSGLLFVAMFALYFAHVNGMF